MIKIENLYKEYHGKSIIKNISHSFPQSKTTVIIGQSGCGKSTLIKLILGLTEKTRGTILYKRQELTDKNLKEFRFKTGYVTQDGGLFPHLSAFDNVSIMPHYFNWDKKKIISKIEELCQLTSFPEKLLIKFPSQLSGGQKQRVSLMRSLILDPELILLDEPLGALDPMIRSNLQNDLRNIFSKLNKTVLLVTHDMGEAVFFADELILLKSGEIIQVGSPSDLVHKPIDNYVSDFINAQRNHFDEI